jgi:hypothetical protein
LPKTPDDVLLAEEVRSVIEECGSLLELWGADRRFEAALAFRDVEWHVECVREAFLRLGFLERPER